MAKKRIYYAVGAKGELAKSWDWYRDHARDARRGDRVSDVVLLVLGALIPAAAVFSDPWSKRVSVGLGVGVVVVTGLRRVYNWKENWIRFTGASVALATASLYHHYRIGGYGTANDEERDRTLVKRIREIEEAESEAWMALRSTESTSPPTSRRPADEATGQQP